MLSEIYIMYLLEEIHRDIVKTSFSLHTPVMILNFMYGFIPLNNGETLRLCL